MSEDEYNENNNNNQLPRQQIMIKKETPESTEISREND